MRALILPILFPSWQFFREIAPAPCIHYSADNADWQELKLRPKHISALESLKSIFFNPDWNEMLYVLGCAEHLITELSSHHEDVIFDFIVSKLDLADGELKFKLTFVTDTNEEVLYESKPRTIGGEA